MVDIETVTHLLIVSNLIPNPFDFNYFSLLLFLYFHLSYSYFLLLFSSFFTILDIQLAYRNFSYYFAPP